MKNILLALILMLAFLPQMSFGATDASTTFDQKQDADRIAFAQQQAQERAAFVKSNQAVIDKQNRRGKWIFEHKSHHHGLIGDTSTMPADLSPQESGLISIFMQKQRGEWQVFSQQQAQEKQRFLSAQSSSTNPTGV